MMDLGSVLQDLRSPLEGLGMRMDGLEGSLTMEPLAGDGSDRRFFRLRSGSLRVVLLCSSPPKEGKTGEDLSYQLIGTHLRRQGIPVPEILWSDLKRGLFLLEDLGDCHLQKLASRPGRNLDLIYGEVLRLLVCLHQKSRKGFREDFCFDTPRYSPSFIYTRELEYFRKAFLIHCLHEEVHEAELKHDFQKLAEAAGTFPPSLVFHRDFQSRNVMVFQGKLKLIDFQGMRFGPPTYDLASMLLDPYVQLDGRLQKNILKLYWKLACKLWNGKHRDFRKSYESVRLCRNLQVLGAYGFLGLGKGKKQFLRYIPRAWNQLLQWLAGPVRGRYPQLEKRLREIERRKSHFIHRRQFAPAQCPSSDRSEA